MTQPTGTSLLTLEDCRVERSMQGDREYTLWRFSPLELLGDPYPQAQRVDMPPDTVAGAHFHDVDQFTVYVGSPGALFQRKPINQLLVHYTDAYSTYGPFSTSSHPMEYLTLRGRPSKLRAAMPQDRDKLIHKGRRNIKIEVELEPSRRLAPGLSEIETLIAPQDDHLAAYCLRAGPNGIVESPDASASFGGYVCVFGGTVRVRDRTYGRYSLGWIDPADPPITFEAIDNESFCVLALYLPSPPTFDRN